MAIFPGGPELAGTRMSPFWILLELREMEVTTGAIRHAKLQSNRHNQHMDTHVFFFKRMPSRHPTNSVRQSTEGTQLDNPNLA